MRVKDELEALRHDTDEILGVLRGRKPCRWGICHPDAECSCEPTPDPVDYGTTKSPAAGQFVALFSALRGALVTLPPSFYQRKGRRVLIACGCRTALDIPVGSFKECRCGRLFCATRRSVRVLPLEQ